MVGLAQVKDRDEVMLVTNGGMLIRIKVHGISVIGRNTQGVRLITLESAGEKVSGISKLPEATEENGDGGNGVEIGPPAGRATGPRSPTRRGVLSRGAEKTRTLTKLWRYLRDPGVAAWRKLAGVAAVAYVLWPLDLIPDGIPVLGWLDDAGILAAAAAFLVAEVRRHERRLDRGAGPGRRRAADAAWDGPSARARRDPTPGARQAASRWSALSSSSAVNGFSTTA